MSRAPKPAKRKFWQQRYGRAMLVLLLGTGAFLAMCLVVGLATGNSHLVWTTLIAIGALGLFVLFAAVEHGLDRTSHTIAARMLFRAGNSLGDARDDVLGLTMAALVSAVIGFGGLAVLVLAVWARLNGLVGIWPAVAIGGAGVMVAFIAFSSAVGPLWDVIAGGSTLRLIEAIEAMWRAMFRPRTQGTTTGIERERSPSQK